MSDPCTQIALSVDVGSDPISGQVTVASGPAAPFRGWIELAAAIEAARVPILGAGLSPGGSPGANAIEL